MKSKEELEAPEISRIYKASADIGFCNISAYVAENYKEFVVLIADKSVELTATLDLVREVFYVAENKPVVVCADAALNKLVTLKKGIRATTLRIFKTESSTPDVQYYCPRKDTYSVLKYDTEVTREDDMYGDAYPSEYNVIAQAIAEACLRKRGLS